MPNDLPTAFDHPEARARATAPDARRDRISVRDHVVEVEIGAFQAERGRTQRVRFDIVVEVRPHDAARSDDVDRILSYDTLTDAIAAELAAERLNLLETLAERIAARILTAPQALRCFVRIEKLDRGPGALGVEIERAAAPTPRRVADDIPHPVVVWLSNAALSGPALAEWLDGLEAAEAPAILCVGLPDGPRPASAVAPAQRRIDLLAIEQNAWVLAGRDRRCVVTHSRTELEWAMRQGRISVWAPSKLVLDSVAPPEAGPEDGPGLAAWLATELGARELVVVGGPMPATDLAVRAVAADAALLV
ncbi:FolB domain-containing protein [Rhodobacteraceae bacterium CCMM004]|nr:FolB domain-containing protein [Rhodobacteraceae bacterium CCMM004]